MRPHRSYVICTCPRSGSWLLSEGLLATGLAGRPEEYLRPDWYQRFQATGHLSYQHRLHRNDPWAVPSTTSNGSNLRKRRDTGFSSFLDAVLNVGTTPNGVFGMKLHWNQLERAAGRLGSVMEGGVSKAEALANWLPAPTFVYLRRRDQLRRAVSHYRAIRSDEWWLADGATPSLLTGEVDFGEIDRLRRLTEQHHQQWRDFFHEAGIEPLELLYEELQPAPRTAVAMVLERIGVGKPDPELLPPPRLRRQADEWTELTVRSYAAWLKSNKERHEDLSQATET